MWTYFILTVTVREILLLVFTLEVRGKRHKALHVPRTTERSGLQTPGCLAPEYKLLKQLCLHDWKDIKAFLADKNFWHALKWHLHFLYYIWSLKYIQEFHISEAFWCIIKSERNLTSRQCLDSITDATGQWALCLPLRAGRGWPRTRTPLTRLSMSPCWSWTNRALMAAM